MILLDANVLVRMADRDSPSYALTTAAVFKLRQTDRLVVVPQSLFEFWAVATRATTLNGLGMDTPRTARWAARFRAMFQLLPDPPSLLDRWQALVTLHNIKGFQVHDVRYVAAMDCLGLTTLLTHNLKHFKPFNLTLIDPAQV